MKENIRLIVKGLIIGLGKIIPGVSGGMLAISLGVYEKGLDALSHFFRNVKENTKFLCLLGLGILISVVLMSKLIKFSLDNYYLPTMLLFIGLISNADDDGYGRANPKLLKSLIFPYDDLRASDLEKWLSQLGVLNMIVLFKYNGQTYYNIPNFLRYQTINKPTKSILPHMEDERC